MELDEATSPVAFKVNVARLPQKGMPVVIEADAAQREALALEHDLLEVGRYRAELLVTPWRRNGVKVTGKVSADVVQQCVVTLEPMNAKVSADVEGLYLPEDSKLGRQGFEGGGEILLDADGPDGPELFSGDTIDPGALAEEFFGLALDPYPRKPGAAVGKPAGDSGKSEPNGPLQEKLRKLTQKS
jgi:hypothetical protein